MTTKIDARTRALIRDLAGLQILLENNDRLLLIDQAIAEDEARHKKACDEATQARIDAEAAIAKIEAEAAQAKENIAAEVAALAAKRDDLDNTLAATQEAQAKAECELTEVMAKLKATQEELARIASRIGG